MPKLKHSWPFLLALLGNAIFLQEVFVSGIYGLTIQLGIGLSRASFFTGFMMVISAGIYGVSTTYLFKRRFPGDLSWLLAIFGAIPFLGFFFFLYDVWIDPQPNVFIMFVGVYSLVLLMIYGARQWRKPDLYTTRFSRAKHIFVGIMLGSAFLIGMFFLINSLGLHMESAITYGVFTLYLILAQIVFQLALFFNTMDHQAHENGQVQQINVAGLIEELGQK